MINLTVKLNFKFKYRHPAAYYQIRTLIKTYIKPVTMQKLCLDYLYRLEEQPIIWNTVNLLLSEHKLTWAFKRDWRVITLLVMASFFYYPPTDTWTPKYITLIQNQFYQLLINHPQLPQTIKAKFEATYKNELPPISNLPKPLWTKSPKAYWSKIWKTTNSSKILFEALGTIIEADSNKIKLYNQFGFYLAFFWLLQCEYNYYKSNQPTMINERWTFAKFFDLQLDVIKAYVSSTEQLFPKQFNLIVAAINKWSGR